MCGLPSCVYYTPTLALDIIRSQLGIDLTAKYSSCYLLRVLVC